MSATVKPMALPAMAESAWLSKVLDTCRLFRWRHVHFEPGLTSRGAWQTPFSGNSGFPDLVLVKNGRVIFAELKTESGVLTSDQRAWLDDLTAAGQECYVFRPSDWDQVYKVLSGPGYR